MSSQPTFNFAGCTVQGDLNTGTQKKSNITGSKYFATGDNATFTIYEKGERKKEGYDMAKNPRGECLIISNKNFQKAKSVRKGAEQDVEQLRKTFQWLQFNVNIEEDCSATQIKQHIDKYSKMSHESFDCFVCCILSHGNLEEIHGVDGNPIYTYNIMKSFEKCETLVGKPKLFFVQACRTKDDDKGLMPHAAADYAFGYASPPGHTAWTDPETGSWFISTLCQVLQETAKDTDLVQMLIEVNERVSEKVDQKNHAPVETPSTLSKKLYFNQPEPFNL